MNLSFATMAHFIIFSLINWTSGAAIYPFISETTIPPLNSFNRTLNQQPPPDVFELDWIQKLGLALISMFNHVGLNVME